MSHVDILNRLRVEADACRDLHRDRTAHIYEKAASEIDRLRAEVERLRADAERYRWLREQDWIDGAISDVHDIDCKDPQTLDAAIDAARREGK